MQEYSSKHDLKCNCHRRNLCDKFHDRKYDHELELVPHKYQFNIFQNTRDQLNKCKSQLDKYPLENWSKHTEYTEISSAIKDHVRKILKSSIIPAILTRAWIKFYDILYTFELIDPRLDNSVLFLCEAPGAFVNATNHFIKSQSSNSKFEWIANTLNPYYEEIDSRSCIWNDTFIREPNCFQNWFFGQSNRGDIFEKSYNESLKIRNKNKKFHLVIGDGAFDCFDCFDRQEESVFPLIRAEIKIALDHLAHYGHLVVKFFTFFDCQTISLLYLLTNCFSSVCSYKPVASKKGNSEVYVVCQNFDRNYFLKIWSNNLNKDADFILNKEAIPKKFIENISELIEDLSDKQIEAINRNVELYESETIDHDQIWQQKDYLAKFFIEEFKIIDISPTDQLVYPSAYYQKYRSDVFLSSLRKFYDYRSKIDNEELPELCRIIASETIKDQSNKLTDVEYEMKYVTNEMKAIKPAYGTPYKILNNSRYVCIFLIKSYEALRSYDKRQLLQDDLQPINEILKKYGKNLKYFNFKLDITDINDDSNNSNKWYFIDLLTKTKSIDSNDYKMCRHLFEKFFEINFNDGDSLLFRCQTLLSRLSVSLVFILSRFFKSYLFYATSSGIYCLLHDYNESYKDKHNDFYKEMMLPNFWNENLLELISVPFIQSNPIFFQKITNVNNYNLFFKLRIISNDFMIQNDSRNDLSY